jgi:two-component system sensor histidine kinase AlgZ
MNPNNQTYFLPNLCKASTLGVLVIAAEIIAFVLLLLKPWDEISIELFGWISLLLQWVVLMSAALLCAVRPLLMKIPNIAAASVSFSIVIMVVVLMTAALGWLQDGLVDWQRMFKNGAVAALIGGLLLRYLYVHAELLQRSQAELEARIDALQSRIRPHFLFNSMNTIASLIMVDPEKAEQAVEDLSALFRATLGEHKERVTFSEEVALCKKYLAMESLRLGDRLSVEWLLDKVPDHCPIPLLTLQPILENAIYHGIQPSASKGWIKVQAEAFHGRVRITVSNSVPKAGISNHQGHKMALDNIRARLKAIYGESASLEGCFEEDCYVSTIIYSFE